MKDMGKECSEQAHQLSSLEEKIEMMNMEYQDRLKAIESRKQELRAIEEEYCDNQQITRDLEKQRHKALIYLNKAHVNILELEMKIDNSCKAITKLQIIHEELHVSLQERTSILKRINAMALTPEIQTRALKRFNKYLRETKASINAKLMDMKAKISDMVQSHLNSNHQSEMVHIHEEIVALRRMLDHQRTLRGKIQSDADHRQMLLTTLKRKVEDINKSLQEEEQRYTTFYQQEQTSTNKLPVASVDANPTVIQEGEDEG